MDGNMKGNGRMIRNMVMVGNCWPMDLNTREIMLWVNHMDKANLFGLMEKSMKVNGTKVLRKVKVINLILYLKGTWYGLKGE